MAYTKGRAGTLEASTNGSSYTAVGGVRSITFSEAHEEVDDTALDDGGNKVSDYGEYQVSLSVDYIRDEADSGQDIIRTQKAAAALCYFRYRPTVAGSAEQYYGAFTITSLENSNERNAKVACSLQAVSSGAITKDTQ